VHSTTYSDRLTELKGLQKLSKDWYLLKFFDVFICFMDRVGFKLMFLIHLIQEQGDLKLRVRTLESERAFQRVAAVQRTVGNVSLADFHQLIEDFFFPARDNCTNNQFVPFHILFCFINYKEKNL
jgi:hypothetical protein